MKDVDVRLAVHATAIKEILSEDVSSIVLDEFGVCLGSTRIDIAVINGKLHGYELKSDKDTLERLPSQVEMFSRVFDHVTLIAGSRHIDRVAGMIPDWWGLVVATEISGRTTTTALREPKDNPAVDPVSLAQLLWKNEMLSILDQHGLSKGIKSKPCPYLWQFMAQSFKLEELKQLVRSTLRARTDWREQSRFRFETEPSLCGGLHQQ